jgi:hypothetical protein
VEKGGNGVAIPPCPPHILGYTTTRPPGDLPPVKITTKF